MRTARIISQSIFFMLFVLFFFFAAAIPAAYVFPSSYFLRLNPLVSATTMLASRSLFLPLLIPGGVVILLSIVLGRFFCGWVCPLGSCIDFSDTFIIGTGRNPARRPPVYFQRLKYVLLGMVLVLAVMGVTFPLFFDPISLLTRLTVFLVYPLLRLLGSDAAHLGRTFGLEAFSTVTMKIPRFYNGAAAAALLLLIFGAGFWDKRFWCQYVCPSGAMFGLLGRYARVRRVVNVEGCSSCNRCARHCPMRAIGDDVSRTISAECIVCGICADLKNGCSSFVFLSPFKPHGHSPHLPADIKRRNVVAGILGGMVLLPVLRADAVHKRDGHGRLIRPPGAVPETEFLARCIACGACLKVCPTKALQPCLPSDGLSRVFTPTVVPRIGGCEEKCHACGYVCPTGAIRRLPHDEKEFVKIGTAVIDRHRCLAWTQNKECLVCDEICPYNAITAQVEQTTRGLFKVPVVDEDLCLGCGMCEQHCPINDMAAIIVYRFGERRLSTGNYASPSQKERIRQLRRVSDEHLSVDAVTRATAQAGGEHPAAPANGLPTDTESTGLPPGFTD